ncbi:hypothetical protein BBD42_30955 [Paenibacillus sp. BIHB 4019]|uniref:Uncharacterized protein n=1 Tax=Paenibacillus sp. BIHB 4019 TaxID=1870819 RepID=A0A1B2DRS8_9BACL|nr:hypothetical protein [Paenibacillus sp. BIHB 4019]ANY70424.1 hypothetical protein BBD42_30955 [Paenibacillus sp. BIHB 4019]
MIKGMQRKYIVHKIEDVESYLSATQRAQIGVIGATIDSRRIEEGKAPASNNSYIVINTDESYAAEIVEILKRHGHWG